MKSCFTGRHIVAGVMAAAVSVSAPAMAQEALPEGSITLIVPFSAGGATDVVGRLVAAEMGERLDRKVIVENVGGAGGTLGAARLTTAEPDGMTLLLGTVATHAIQPLAMATPPYDPVADFAPVSLLVTVPNVIAVNNDVPATTLAELADLLREAPGEYSYGTSGIGTPPHLSGERFRAATGLDIVHVPYNGGGPAMTDLIGGQIPLLFDVLSGAAGPIRAGSVRALAVTTAERSAAFPDLPTVAESGIDGLQDYETYTWNAIFAPAGTPQGIVATLNEALVAAVNDPETNAKLIELSGTPVGSSPEELTELIRSEMEKWGAVIDEAGLELQ